MKDKYDDIVVVQDMEPAETHTAALDKNERLVDVNLNDNVVPNRELKEKFFFLKFLMYNSKIEHQYEMFTSFIYWTSILEIVLWTVCLIFFFVNTKIYGIIFALILHVPKGIIGLLVLKYIPNSYQVLEDLGETANDTIDDVQEKIFSNFNKLIKDNDSDANIRRLLISYFLLTMINLVIDVIIMIYVFGYWKLNPHPFGIIMLSFLTVFLCKYFKI